MADSKETYICPYCDKPVPLFIGIRFDVLILHYSGMFKRCPGTGFPIRFNGEDEHG